MHTSNQMGRDSKIGQKHESSVLSNLEVWLARDKTSIHNTGIYGTSPYHMYFYLASKEETIKHD
jgi:hypothetical protein